MVNRKVFDIIPPKEPLPAGRQGKESVPIVETPKKRPDFAEKLEPVSKKIVFESAPDIKRVFGKKVLWWPVITVLAIVCIGGVSFFLIKPKAEVEIWPQKTPLEVKSQIVVGSDIVGEEKTYDCPVSQEFPATGVKSSNAKAMGTIRVYNAYSTSPQTLITSTRFVSDGGKLFRTPQKIVIPGAHYEGGKLVPGEVDATVEAGEPGEDYNIGPSTFSLPALAGTPRYTAFYAKSFESMKGGSKDEKLQVTRADLDNAQKTLTVTALDNCQKSLASSLSLEEYIVLPEALESAVIELNPLAKEGQEVDRFVFQMKARATGLVFKKQDLENFAKNYLLSQVPEGKNLAQNSIAVSFLPKTVDLEKKKITLTAEISGQIYPTIDENRLKEAIKNQRPDEMTSTLRQFPEIEKFQARLWPFWVSRAPLETTGIAIKLRLD